MKPAIIATHYLPHIGGLELATYHLANELTKLDNEVHVITPYPNPSEEKSSAIQVHRHPINTYPDEPSLRAFIDGITFFRQALKTIEGIKPDIIHAQNITNSIPAYLAWKKYHIPYVICIHGNLELMGPFLPKPLKRFWKNLPHIKSAAGIIALTPEMWGRIENELGHTSQVIPNGVDLEKFYPAIDEKKISAKKTIVTLSRIDDKKGLEYAIQSMTKIIEKYPDVRLKIIGDGDYRKTLEKLVDELSLRDCVEFTGLIPNDEVPDNLRDADIFLLPSLFEGLPLTLLEAMACGLPVISTPVSIAPDMVNKWNCGVIVPFKSPDAIAGAVSDLLSNHEAMKSIGKRGALAAKESASWKSIAEKYVRLYSSIIGRD